MPSTVRYTPDAVNTKRTPDWEIAVSELGACDARMLIDLATDRKADTVQRAAACFVLGQRRDQSAVTTLMEVASDPFELVSLTAIRALFVIGSRRPTRSLIRLASSAKSINVRTAAISALGFLGDPRSQPALRRFLADADDIIRSVSASSLSGIKCKKATLKALAERLERDSNPRVRWAAALTLGNVAGPDELEVLERHLGDEEKVNDIPGQPSVAEGVRDAILRLRERST